MVVGGTSSNGHHYLVPGCNVAFQVVSFIKPI